MLQNCEGDTILKNRKSCCRGLPRYHNNKNLGIRVLELFTCTSFAISIITIFTGTSICSNSVSTGSYLAGTVMTVTTTLINI